MSDDAYLLRSAADAFARIMGDLYPEQTWVGVVRERKPLDGSRETSAAVLGENSRAFPKDSDLLLRGDTAFTDDDHLNEAA